MKIFFVIATVIFSLSSSSSAVGSSSTTNKDNVSKINANKLSENITCTQNDQLNSIICEVFEKKLWVVFNSDLKLKFLPMKTEKIRKIKIILKEKSKICINKSFLNEFKNMNENFEVEIEGDDESYHFNGNTLIFEEFAFDNSKLKNVEITLKNIKRVLFYQKSLLRQNYVKLLVKIKAEKISDLQYHKNNFGSMTSFNIQLNDVSNVHFYKGLLEGQNNGMNIDEASIFISNSENVIFDQLNGTKLTLFHVQNSKIDTIGKK